MDFRQYSSVQSLSCVQHFATPWTAAHQPSLSITKLSELAQTHVHWVGWLCHPTISSSGIPFSSCLQSFRASGSVPTSQFFASGGQSIGVSAVNIRKYSGLTSFRINWFDLLAVQGTLKSLLQQNSSKASILQCSAFVIIQLSHPYMTTGKTTALTGWTFVGKVMSLLFNTLSRLVIALLPRSKHLLISWLQSPSAVIWEPKKIQTDFKSWIWLYSWYIFNFQLYLLSYINLQLYIYISYKMRIRIILSSESVWGLMWESM